jgi:PEP-CTERM/exosortase A-associated glycosyltransferase
MTVVAVRHERAPVLATERLLVVNADDFGMSHGTTRGVIQAHERGIVTSTSLMVLREAADEGAAYARAHPRLGVGLHLDLCEWRYYNDEWHLLYERVRLDDSDEVAAELTRQLERFEELVGRSPSHIDTHQHVHREDVVGAVVSERARALRVPVRDLSPGLRYRGEFYGQSSKGLSYPDWITPAALVDLLGSLAPGVTEVSCHPGIDPAEAGGYASERAVELASLCAPPVLDTIVEHGITLVSFADVAPLLEHGVESWRSGFEQRSEEATRAGDHAAAVRWSRRAVETEPSHVASWLALSRSYARSGDAAGAAAAVEEAVRLQPKWASVLLQHADVLAAAGRRMEAASVLSDVAARNTARPDLLRRVVRRLSKLGVDERSLEVAETLLEAVPGDEEGRLAKAAALARSGRRREALEIAAGARVPRAIAFMLDIGAAEEAWQLAEQQGAAALPAAVLLRTALALRKRGHLTLAERALAAAATAAEDDAVIRDRVDALAGEHRVLREGFTAPALKRRRYRARTGVVLHVVGHSSPHSQVGYTVRTDSIVRAQRAAGLEPHVVTRLGFPWDQGVKDAAPFDVLGDVRYHRLRPAGRTPLRLDDRLAETVTAADRLAREIQPAVIHAASDYRNAAVALTLGEQLGVPVVYEVRGFWEETRLREQGEGAEARECYVLHRERELDCMRRVDHVVTLAEVMRRELVARGVEAERISVIPNGVDENAFSELERDEALAEHLGIRPGEQVLGYISSLSSYEGIEYLIAATARLRRAGRQVRCLIVGDGDVRAALEDQVEALGDPELAIFTGRVPHADVRSYYSLIDVFVVPRTAERVSQLVTPLKPYEAMANGRAVVASRVPALAEMVIDEVNGLTFHPEDDADLAAVVDGLLEQPARRQALGLSARTWVLANRTWSQNGAVYADLYRSLGAA